MFTTLLRIIKYGFQNFWRNGWLSVATLMMMTLALMMFQGLLVLNNIVGVTTATLQEKIDISVYFKTNVTEDDIAKVERDVKKLNEVKEVEYISKEKALEVFQKTYKNDEVIAEALLEVGENPLAASLKVKAKDPKEYAAIAAYLGNEKFSSIIEKVSYHQNKEVINRLTKILETIQIAGIGTNAALIFIAIIMTFNTIRIAMYANREEIGIMRLVGASNAYIRGPYVVEGVMYGILATIFALLFTIPVVYTLAPYLAIVIPTLNIASSLYRNIIVIGGETVVLGIALGVISSSIAITRYLRV